MHVRFSSQEFFNSIERKADNRIAPYIAWMREHREIFEFVDQVGTYGSGWWLDV